MAPTTITNDGHPCIVLPLGTSFEDAKRALFLATMEHHKWHREKVAVTLGLSLKTVYNWAKEFEATPA